MCHIQIILLTNGRLREIHVSHTDTIVNKQNALHHTFQLLQLIYPKGILWEYTAWVLHHPCGLLSPFIAVESLSRFAVLNIDSRGVRVRQHGNTDPGISEPQSLKLEMHQIGEKKRLFLKHFYEDRRGN